ncbi:twin-arginine translocation signal domain-containing protein [Kitasatospora sp. NPDC058406]
MTTPLNRRNALRMASAAAVGAGATVGLAGRPARPDGPAP